MQRIQEIIIYDETVLTKWRTEKQVWFIKITIKMALPGQEHLNDLSKILPHASDKLHTQKNVNTRVQNTL